LLGSRRAWAANTVAAPQLHTKAVSEHHHSVGGEKGREEEGTTVWERENGTGG